MMKVPFPQQSFQTYNLVNRSTRRLDECSLMMSKRRPYQTPNNKCYQYLIHGRNDNAIMNSNGILKSSIFDRRSYSKVKSTCDISNLERPLSKKEYTAFQKKLRKYKPETSQELTDWINSIRNSNIKFLQPDEDFVDDKKSIQVKMLNQDDLQSQEKLISHVPDETDESLYDQDVQLSHEFETRLDVIKLPSPIPLEDNDFLPEYLFIRPDEYALFIILTNIKKSILIGNPGISKSWFQYKFILFCYREDLFAKLWSIHAPFVEMGLDACDANNKISGKVIGAMEEPSTSSEIEKGVAKIPSIDPGASIPTSPFIPNLIVRTEGGTQSILFFVGRGVDCDVQVIENHSPRSFKFFTNENSTILWEPGEESQPVAYLSIFANIIATVSPRMDRFHEFAKYARKFYMPCPSEIHLRLMGKIIRDIKPNHYPSDDEIRTRIKEYGPFIRTSLIWGSPMLEDLKSRRHAEIVDLCQDNYANLIASMNAGQHVFFNLGERLRGFSYRLVRLDSNRHTNVVGQLPYESFSYSPCSVEVSSIIKQQIRFIPTNAVKESLLKHQEGMMQGNDDEWLYAKLERLFVGYSTSEGGLTWNCRKMLYRDDVAATMKAKANVNDGWTPFSLEFKDALSIDPVSFQETKVGVLYYPNDSQFPLVDAYWKISETVLGCVQATKSAKHAKNTSVYEKFLTILSVPYEVQIQIYYLSIPQNETHYSQKSFASTQFWLDIKQSASKIEQLKQRIEFYVLLPPISYEAIIPKMLDSK
jgi:hypothetical protein